MSGYTTKQAAEIIGCSVAFIRKAKRQGKVTPDTARGPNGPELRFSADQVETLQALYHRPRVSGQTSTALVAADVMRERLEAMQAERDALLERAVIAEAQAARVQALEDEITAERQRTDELHRRVESLKGLGVWGYLTGKHRSV